MKPRFEVKVVVDVAKVIATIWVIVYFFLR